jgi:hypothetical protein
MNEKKLNDDFRLPPNACPICGLNGHMMTNYPKFVKMQNIFQGKNASNTNEKLIVNVKIITIIMNTVDVNVTTKSRITKKQMFHEQKLRKNEIIANWEKQLKLKKMMVDTIQL